MNDSARFVVWSRLFDWRDALVIVKPETLIGWHRKGFRLFWKWKSRVGRPRLPENIRKLIVDTKPFFHAFLSAYSISTFLPILWGTGYRGFAIVPRHCKFEGADLKKSIDAAIK